MVHEQDFLTRKKQELEKLKKEMANSQEKIIQASIDFVKNWYEKEIQKTVKVKHEITKNLSKDKLSELKSNCRQIIDNTDNFVKDLLSDKELWWHLTTKQRMSLMPDGKYIPTNFAVLLKSALVEMLQIFEKYGYYESKQGLTKDSEESEKRIYKKYGDPETDIIRKEYYPHQVDWSTNLHSAFEQYAELNHQADKIVAEIKSLEENIKQDEAKKLWESID